MQVRQIHNKNRLAIISMFLLLAIIVTPTFFEYVSAVKPIPKVPVFLDPLTITKYQNQLVVPPVYTPNTPGGSEYTVRMVNIDPTTGKQYRQQILPVGTVLPAGGDGKTAVWGYEGNAVAKGATLATDGTTLSNFLFSPSATFEAVKGTPITVNWVNEINVPQPFAVDPTLYWANPGNTFPPGDIFSVTGAPFSAFPPGYDGTITATNPLGLNAQKPVALVPHLHGAEVDSRFDGGPESWWTAAGTNGAGNLKGPNYASNLGAGTPVGQAQYVYANAQEPNTLWYHDHALGITRINVMSGLAGYYLLRDPTATVTLPLTASNFDEYLTQTFQYGISEIPIAIQDRTFRSNGELWFPEVGNSPKIHPYWNPEFFGNTIMVNGRVWPNLDVTPGIYRLRLLDGSNARFYTLSFSNAGVALPFTVIGEDGGYLQSPTLASTLTIAPGERADILVDFTNVAVGSKIILTNTATAPFPAGVAADPLTTGQIMQFTVKATTGDPTRINEVQGPTTIATLPTSLNPTLPAGAFPTLPTPAGMTRRTITLKEVMGPGGPIMVTINGQYYAGTATEIPRVGDTEEWVIVNLTADTHPIHLHLVTFQLVNRQLFKVNQYNNDWLKLNKLFAPPFPKAYVPTALNPTPYLQGLPIGPTATEMTWKDTLQMNPGEVTTIKVRIAPQDAPTSGAGMPTPGTNPFAPAFDPTIGPGYVWHCHIIDHEDNEMMRPLIIKP